MVVPVLLSNLIQAVQGGRLPFALRRFWPLILAQLVATVLAVYFSQSWSIRAINGFMAVTVILAVLSMVMQPRGEIAPRHQVWLAPLVGAMSGALGGVSSLSGPMIITYLMALRLPREEFVGSISMIYLLGSAPMYLAMLWWGRSSDRSGERVWHLIIAMLFGACGFALAALAPSNAAALAGLSAAYIGVFCTLPIIHNIPATILHGSAAAAGSSSTRTRSRRRRGSSSTCRNVATVRPAS